jgi:hypothetical protein
MERVIMTDGEHNKPAAPQGVAYAELPQADSWVHFLPQFGEAKLRDFADRTHALRASHGQAPAGAAADSVLEDAARLDWLALAGPTSICVVLDRENDGEVEVSTDDVTGYGKTLREALDAARKQGGTHD